MRKLLLIVGLGLLVSCEQCDQHKEEIMKQFPFGSWVILKSNGQRAIVTDYLPCQHKLEVTVMEPS